MVVYRNKTSDHSRIYIYIYTHTQHHNTIGISILNSRYVFFPLSDKKFEKKNSVPHMFL